MRMSMTPKHQIRAKKRRECIGAPARTTQKTAAWLFFVFGVPAYESRIRNPHLQMLYP
jgi:hypothetical protein